MNKNLVVKYSVTIFLLMLVFSSCKHKENEYHNLMDKIEAHSIYTKDTTAVLEKEDFESKMIEITEGHHRFLIPDRKSQIKSYACAECHIGSLVKMKNKEAYKKAHWDIKLNHANEEIMNCLTCHNPQEMNSLKSLTGANIDLNKSYRLCSQCHSSQFEDWKGGAHGKNIGGWTSPRAAMTCVNCHNPHKPQILSKWPARFNTNTESLRK